MVLIISIFIFLFLSADTVVFAVDPHFEACRVPTTCGDNQTIRYPFYIQDRQRRFCGYDGFVLQCHPDGHPIIKLSGRDYLVRNISYETESLRVSDAAISTTSACLPLIENISLPLHMFQAAPGQTELDLVYNCSSTAGGKLVLNGTVGKASVCSGSSITGEVVAVKGGGPGGSGDKVEEYCGRGVVVVRTTVEEEGSGGVVEALSRGFVLKWTAGNCTRCTESRGFCGFDEKDHFFKCYCPDRPHALHCVPPPAPGEEGKSLKIALGVGAPGVILLMLLYGLWYYRKRRAAPNVLTRNISCQPHSKSDLEDGGVCFEVPVFSYFELEKATNKFDNDRELGDGGFGTVYHGLLHDGREVAVKRLYQHNYRRVEQFMNEVKILTRLHHKNLVSLYGCTSTRSRELLLVYEYVPNGTVADHLHGEEANSSLLTWPIRMSIAIETASALVYLHASDIIHRDVKTNNILLDKNFTVKVADFGISRLFPNDVSHVSTAPQGTPGYVDPEYYQCYQLTTKSDVFSFGVVLIELISSMPAVDITRHRHEINLSNLALNKILRQELDELIDPCLGFESDEKVRGMITAVAWLAFECLQEDKERRPTMEEALETLKRIESGEREEREDDEQENIRVLRSFQPTPSPEYDEVQLLKHKRQLSSPTSVAVKWISSASVSSIS